MSEGARCFRSISPGDFLGLAPLCFQLGLGAILHARGISWSCCRLLARSGAKEEDWFPFSLSRRLMALVNHSPFGAPFLRLLCVDICCVGTGTDTGNRSERVRRAIRLTIKGVVLLFFLNWGGAFWIILSNNVRLGRTDFETRFFRVLHHEFALPCYYTVPILSLSWHLRSSSPSIANSDLKLIAFWQSFRAAIQPRLI